MGIIKCKRCGEEKTWKGDDITCPFQSSDNFGDNWNCGIIGKIRLLCEKAMEGDDYRLQYQYCDDQKYVVIKTDEIENMGLCLWVTWYKSRGRTEAMWILDEYNTPRLPTYNDLEQIANYYLKG